ncbi:MAG: hypothetical protein F4231_02715 [Acidimicrobiaceae bacterium]|nr:hypothetical protein [Acidimicrobiaceae bacterium]
MAVLADPTGTAAVVFGAGATGLRIVRMLDDSPSVRSVELRDTDLDRLGEVTSMLGPKTRTGQGAAVPEDTDVVVVATPTGSQANLARAAVEAGATVVTTTNEIAETRHLLAAGSEARRRGVPLVVGAGYMPGLTCLLARVGALEFDAVDEIHVAKVGTGGPACARQHHRALSSLAIDWRDGRWTRRAGGSGRELCWFPDPVAGRDCYRAALPDALLLVPAFPGVDRVTARMAATRRDRLTAPLPMMRRPHPEGGVGAVRVELRGWRRGERHVLVLGSQAKPAHGAAVVAAATALHLVGREAPAGAAGLASIPDPDRLLQAVAALGLRPSRFEGFALSRASQV